MMTPRTRALLALALSTIGLGTIALTQPGCASEGRNTQVIVTVDAEPGVRAMANTLIVRVYGGPRGEALPSTFVLERPFDVSAGSGTWPRTVALAPNQRDATRIYRFEALAFREGSPGEGAMPVATVRLISGYVNGETLHVRLVLQDACVGRQCGEDETCDRGLCIDATVPIEELSRDGGTPSMDGGMDGGAGCTAAGCDDGASCTEDFCMPDGSCGHRYDDVVCDDGELCTDDSCAGASGDPVTGCLHEANTLGCDDGVFCNGVDVCAGGTCTHPGSPCGALTCREDPDGCTGCSSVSDCPMPSTGPFGACTGFADSCDESGTHVAMRTTYECVSTVCQPTMIPVSEDCSRSTTGTSCAPSAFGEWTSCAFAPPCGLTGARSRTRSDFVCAAGTCGSSVTSETEACTRPDGFPCSDGNACTMGDTCMLGSCVSGSPVCGGDGGTGGCTSSTQCDDGVVCTIDTCVSGTCMNMADNAACSPPFGCGTTWCSPIYDCQIDYTGCDECAFDSDCFDADPCNIDHCNLGTVPRRCEHYPGFCDAGGSRMDAGGTTFPDGGVSLSEGGTIPGPG